MGLHRALRSIVVILRVGLQEDCAKRWQPGKCYKYKLFLTRSLNQFLPFKVKVNFNLQQSMKAQKESETTALFFFNFDAKLWWVVVLPLRKRSGLSGY